MQVHSKDEFTEQMKLYRSIFVGHLCDPVHHALAYVIPVMLKVCLWKDISMFVETPLLPAACLQRGENSCCAAASILSGCQARALPFGSNSRKLASGFLVRCCISPRASTLL